jgi:hypothetical protein
MHIKHGMWTAAALGLFIAALPLTAEEAMLRNRGEGFYYSQSANTTGSGNLWAGAHAMGFIWDDPTKGKSLMPKLFLDVNGEWGVLNYLSLLADSRIVSYPWNRRPQFGTLGGGLKATLPNNKDLRFLGLGAQVRCYYSFLENFPSLAGYRTGGTGFSPEGFICYGGVFEWKALYDQDYIALYSWLPVKLMVNGGMRIPFDPAYVHYSQYLAAAGVGYVGLMVDAFAEFSIEGFMNRSTKPKFFPMSWFTDDKGLPATKYWEVAFTENPMFLTLGGRLRYSDGLILSLYVPLLLSVNQGSDITYGGDQTRLKTDFPDEYARGVRDPFDPWYARWKVVAEASVAVMYRQTGAEMRRSFLLMKSRKRGPTIDIDQKIKALELQGQGADSTAAPAPEEKSDQQRLEEIKKRREELKKGQ